MNRKLLPVWMQNVNESKKPRSLSLREEADRTLRDIALVLEWTRRVREEILASPQEELAHA